MNTKDIRNSTDPDLAGSYAAMERAARAAQDLAIKTNTSILVSVDGKDVEKGSIFQGQTKTYKGTTAISVYFSNPAGLDVTFNGKLLAPLGGQNEEVRRTFR